MEEPTTDEVVNAVLTASRVLVAVSGRSLADSDDSLTLVQFRCLVVLHAHDQLNLNGVADALGVRPSTALRTVDKMVAAGFVVRRENADNRREVVLSLTPSGERLVLEVTERRAREIAEILGGMSARRRSDLVTAFRAFTEAAGEPQARRAAMEALDW